MMSENVQEIRCFVCIEPALSVLRNLENWLESLKPLAPRLKWGRSGALHLTLKFCGQVPVGQVERLSEGLRSELQSCAPFVLGLEGTGVFPPKGAPRVLWGGVTGDEAALCDLFERVERVSVSCGIAREKRSFSPHLTLARIRAATDFPRSWLHAGPPGSSAWGTWTVREVTLMESDLRPEGPLYSPIEKFSLLKIQGGGR